jgi:S1-C subfamily serine protease
MQSGSPIPSSGIAPVSSGTGTDRLKILIVAPSSPAERANIKEGSEIVAVNGEDIDGAFAGSTKSQWAHHPPGMVVELTLADGSVYSLTLEDDY